MIVSLKIKNFKSIADLDINLEKFTCLVGLNGAGKSSLLQGIDFASHLMTGDIRAWLQRRNWDAQDLHSKFSTASNIVIFITIELSNKKRYTWKTAFNRQLLSCTREEIHDLQTGEIIFNSNKGRYSVTGGDYSKINFNFEGSLLSHLKKEILNKDLIEIRERISSIRSFELLSPHLMRSTSRDSCTDIGAGGEKLASFLHNLKGELRDTLTNLLRTFYPRVIDFKTVQKKAGWKQLFVIEEFNGRQIETEAKHINDGLLRILAILAQTNSSQSMILFDEIENGINPEIVETLVNLLQNSPQQIIVTTHSPLVLNYLSDETAKNSVQFIYRGIEGGTKAAPLFSMNRIREKLEYMGPGEVFVDTNLTALTSEFVNLSEETS
ncbi:MULTISPECIES: AAA family ATPase [Pseudomonas]|jgi:predicted ATPase|uniref:AAA family ATPase n=1 Tax=Pseudomonas TaxID=286 RepID=UPI000F03D8BA|nr:AAA family ATPase [Pseudomonas atacamensis]UVL12216.1 AAA family ATPase [Pseudomonas atacamensis]